MNYVFSLAFKNILRNKRRTALTFSMLIFGVAFYIIISAMFTGFDKSAFESIVNFDSGHIKIRSLDYDSDEPYNLDHILKDPGSILKTLSEEKTVTGAAPRVTFFAEMDNSIDSTPVIVTGIDRKLDPDVFSLEQFYSEGTFEPGSAVVGAELAKELELLPGDYFYLTFRNASESFYSLELWVGALLKSPDPASNKSKVYIDVDLAREVLGIGNAATEITLRTADMKTAKKTAAALRERIPDAEIKSWDELSHAFAQTMETKSKGSQAVLFFILVIAMIGIVNTMLISVYEKRREIGTLKALGLLDSEVRNLFLFEGAFIGLSGSLLGAISGALINIYFATVGIDYASLLEGMGDDMGMGFIGVVKSTWEIEHFLVPVILSTLASAAASYLPARRAMKMEAAESLRTI